MESTDDVKILKDLVVRLMKRIGELESEVAVLKAENTELRTRLKLNSGNSHKPPSSDGLGKKPGCPNSRPRRAGASLATRAKRSRWWRCPTVWSCTMRPVVHAAPRFFRRPMWRPEQKRQVFDIPAPRMEVTEHQVGVITCRGSKTGVFPVEVGQPVQYGPRVAIRN